MLKQLLVICLLLVAFAGKGQNLVPNYSFEELDSCPELSDYYFSVTHNWFSPNKSTPDIYNVCGIYPPAQVPTNWAGFQNPMHGNGYSGILLYVPSIFNYREYLGVRIPPLNMNHYYCLTFYVSLSDEYPLHCSSIGAYFSPDSVFQDDLKRLPFEPQIENPDSNFIDDTTKWQVITGYFKAQGGEQFMYIGNFRSDPNTVVEGFTPGARSYVYIDKVSLEVCYPNDINENLSSPIQFYPNPATSILTIIATNLHNAQLILYDISGRQLLQQQLNSSIQTIDISRLATGVYVAVVSEKGRVESREKVIISE